MIEIPVNASQFNFEKSSNSCERKKKILEAFDMFRNLSPFKKKGNKRVKLSTPTPNR